MEADSSLDFVDSIRAVHIGYAQMGDRLYKTRQSAYVAEDLVYFVKQNEHVIWVISRKPLTHNQFLAALSKYLEKETHERYE